MADITERVANWLAKYKPERLKQTLDELMPQMVARYQATVNEVWTIETKTREVLNASQVHTILYVPYLNYARQLYKLSRRRNISGDSLELASQVLLEKWQNRGLDPNVLNAIRRDVFSISAP